ncbi:TrmH family RNA methyltransferase [Candidatus Carsonella ruddii]|uniref:TrmH family RNA methyltransferase n=1 Tax=Carsonella ruddii TaxID=114186 RepID=UPI001B3C7E30
MACHAEDHGFESRSIRNFINKNILLLNFRKILKKIKILIKFKIRFFILNFFFKKKFFFKNIFLCIFFKNKYKKKFFNKNYVILYLLKNNGNLYSCIRTCYIYNVIPVLNFIKKKKIYSYFNNIFFIKNIFFFIIYIKSKIIISLTNKSNIILKKIKIVIKFIIFIGNEKNSLSKKILKKSDILLKIKTYRKKSLNVNVVNGIILNYLK